MLLKSKIISLKKMQQRMSQEDVIDKKMTKMERKTMRTTFK